MRSRAPLVLMEQLVMLTVFALAAAVCVQAFVLADRLSQTGAARDQAVIAAERAAEIWKSCGGDTASAAAGYGGTAEGVRWQIFYDKNWNRVESGDATAYTVSLTGCADSGLLRTARIEAAPAGDGEALFTLTVSCQRGTAE
jgi:hypothetical protein